MLLITGCAGTRTVYKSDVNSPIKKISITYLNKQHPAINQIFPNLNNIFCNEIQKILSVNGYSVIITTDSIQFDNHNIDKVKAICKFNDIDGLIISRIKFTHVSNYIYFIPTSQYFDNILELKLVDKEGISRIIVNHNTAHDVYMSVPENDVIITTSIDKVTEQLIKGLKLK